MKKQLKIAGIILMTGLFILPMTAFGRGEKDRFRPDIATRMMAPRASNLTAEQITQIENLHKKFRDENADTLKELMTKTFDLNTALDSATPDVAKAKTIQKEISSLEAKLALKRIDLYAELLKIDPKAKFHSRMDRGNKMKRM